MKVLGIDPGIHGGLAVVEVIDGAAPVLVEAIDVPIVGDAAKARVDVAAARNFINAHKPALALVEIAQPMPRQGSSSGFRYGRATGALEAAVVLCGVPVEFVAPAVWKRYWKLPGKDKERARQLALERFPAAHAMLARKRDHGRSEAALLALYGASPRPVGGQSPGKTATKAAPGLDPIPKTTPTEAESAAPHETSVGAAR
jgi:crossover junction endodeoxyribonuclease RuvC